MMAAQKSECPAATGQNANQNLLNKFKHTARRTVLARDTQRQTLLEALQRRPHHALELRKLGIKAPTARIGDLVLAGHDINSTQICITTATGHILSTTLYTLVEVQHG